MSALHTKVDYPVIGLIIIIIAINNYGEYEITSQKVYTHDYPVASFKSRQKKRRDIPRWISDPSYWWNERKKKNHWILQITTWVSRYLANIFIHVSVCYWQRLCLCVSLHAISHDDDNSDHDNDDDGGANATDSLSLWVINVLFLLVVFYSFALSLVECDFVCFYHLWWWREKTPIDLPSSDKKPKHVSILVVFFFVRLWHFDSLLFTQATQLPYLKHRSPYRQAFQQTK